MAISLKPEHLRRYKEIARLLYKYGRTDVVKQMGLHDLLDDRESLVAADGPRPEELAADLEVMGAVYVKLGQVLSSRPDLLPEPYVRALARLQDSVQPFPYEEVERTVQSELGIRIDRVFREFDRGPLAAASLGQVHKAVLRDGRAVVVKVQRPEIRKEISAELEVLEEIAEFFETHTQVGKRYQFLRVFEQFRKTLIHELDYQREAANMSALARNLREFPHIHVPLPIDPLTSRSVLTMEFVPGQKITEATETLKHQVNLSALADELFRAYLKQILVDGLFHADPHPGNVLLTSDGRVALLDLGMVGHLAPDMQENLLKLLLALSQGRGDDAANLVIRLSERTELANEMRFRNAVCSLVAENLNRTMQQIHTGRVLIEATRSAAENGLLVPAEMATLGKTLLQLDEIGRTLDREFDPNRALQENVPRLVASLIGKSFSGAQLLGSSLEIKDLIGRLPGRLNRILDTIADAQFEIRVKATDVNFRVDGFIKIANRITTGLILAALIVGASLLTHVDTRFEVFGYPALAILFFLVAAGMGLWLVASIWIQDRRARNKLPE